MFGGQYELITGLYILVLRTKYVFTYSESIITRLVRFSDTLNKPGFQMSSFRTQGSEIWILISSIRILYIRSILGNLITLSFLIGFWSKFLEFKIIITIKSIKLHPDCMAKVNLYQKRSNLYRKWLKKIWKIQNILTFWYQLTFSIF